MLEEIKSLVATAEPPELGPGPRDGIRSARELNTALEKLFSGSARVSHSTELIRAVVLLWHDHLEEAHLIAQVIENRDGSFVHAIMHRREPDYGNAKYWFRRTGTHSCFPEIAGRSLALFEAEGEKASQTKIIPGGQWDAFAFVDACEEAARTPATDRRIRSLREIQRIETEVLLEFLSRSR